MEIFPLFPAFGVFDDFEEPLDDLLANIGWTISGGLHPPKLGLAVGCVFGNWPAGAIDSTIADVGLGVGTIGANVGEILQKEKEEIARYHCVEKERNKHITTRILKN